MKASKLIAILSICPDAEVLQSYPVDQYEEMTTELEDVLISTEGDEMKFIVK